MTRALRKFARLSPAERALLFRAFFLLLATRLRLALRRPSAFPLRGLTRAPGGPRAASLPPSRYAWSVHHASRLIPGTKCLAQAIALHRLLQRDGHTAVVRIGVAKDSEKGFQAHAWVEHPSGPLLNTPAELRPYTPLASWEGGRL